MWQELHRPRKSGLPLKTAALCRNFPSAAPCPHVINLCISPDETQLGGLLLTGQGIGNKQVFTLELLILCLSLETETVGGEGSPPDSYMRVIGTLRRLLQ